MSDNYHNRSAIYPVVMSCRLWVRKLNSCEYVAWFGNVKIFGSIFEQRRTWAFAAQSRNSTHSLFYNKTLLERTKPWEKKWDARMIEGKMSGSTTTNNKTTTNLSLMLHSSRLNILLWFFKRCSHRKNNNSGIKILLGRHMFPEKTSNSLLCHKQSKQLSV